MKNQESYKENGSISLSLKFNHKEDKDLTAKRLIIILVLLIPVILITIYMVKPDPQDVVLGIIREIEEGHDSALLSKEQNELIRQFIHFGQDRGSGHPIIMNLFLHMKTEKATCIRWSFIIN
jgi:hypothetical protein